MAHKEPYRPTLPPAVEVKGDRCWGQPGFCSQGRSYCVRHGCMAVR